ncbi:MAG: TolC family protein [Desulfobacteraceae bacterium]|jgi:outer membrane protein TolC
MSIKKIKLVSYLLSSMILLTGCILFAGCYHILPGKEKYTYTVPEEKVRQIDTLELTEDKDVEEEKTVTEPEEMDAPAQLKLSIEECRALALENNLDLKVELIDPAIEAEKVIEEEATKFEATFSVDASYQNLNSPPTGYYDVIYGNKRERTSVDYGVEIPLRTGGNIDINITDTRVKTNVPSEFTNMNPSYSPNITASIRQPLLRNAGMRVSTYTIRITEYNRQQSDARTKNETIRIIKEIDKAYWDLYAQRRLLDVRKKEYDLSKDWTEQTKRLVEVGTKPEVDLISARANEADRLEYVIQAKNDLRDMERNLKQKLNKPGLGLNTDTELILSTDPEPVHYEFDKEQIVKKAIENRMDILQLELELAKDENTIEYNRNQLRPDVTLEYEYGINSLGESRHDGYDMLLDNEYHDHTVTLNLEIPLGNKAAKSRLHQAEYGKAKRLIDIENKKAQIEYEVLGSLDQLEASWQSILASRETKKYRDTQYKAEKRQYELGMQTLRDVLLVQKDVADAHRSEIVALTNYQKNLIDLAYNTGTLLGAAKVELESMVPKK